MTLTTLPASATQAAGVACFVKQLGSSPIIHDPAHEWFDGRDFHTGGMTHLRPRLRSNKGGDPSEWPEDLRVREFPAWPPTNHGPQ